jgi:homoserine kinase
MSGFLDRVSVLAPATSANLGPGFDALGLALDLHDRLTAEVSGSGLVIEVSGAGAENVPRDDTHLVYQAMDATFAILGRRPSGLTLTCENVIPHGRGLGSSSAAITAGIVLAHELAGGNILDDATLLQIATDLEGHPDNVAPALLGGFTIAWIDGGAARAHRLDVDQRVSVFVPDEPVATSLARGLLPETVPHADAAFNAGRAALLVAALTGAPELLVSATEDRLHQNYRSSAMPDSHRLVRQLRAEGVPAIISGAGPTVLAFATGLSEATPQGWAHHELGVDTRGTRAISL